MEFRILALVPLCLCGWAQPARLIEAASIRPSGNTKSEANLNSTPGRLTATNVTVGYLIRFAYGVKDYQIGRLPGWADSTQFDIVAKSANGPSANIEDEKAMVRELLGDRFQLATHRETKQMRVYQLMVDKNGPKMTLHNDGTGARSRKSCGHLAGTRQTMDVFATALSRELGTDVLNRTELPGKYDFTLDWTPDAGPCAADSPVLPSFFTAVQQQLGLKLDAAKGPVEILIVDHLEQPSEN